jgi:sugar phosphate isomerase/epimerase
MNPTTRRTFLKSTALGALAFATAPTFAEGRIRYTLVGFTKPFQELGHEECADTVAQIGWDAIECPVRAKGQIEPDAAPDKLPELIEALQKRGKEIAILATDVTSADKESERLLRLASKLGIKRYRVGFIRYDQKKPIAEQVRETAAKMRDLAALNKELGINGGIQNHSGAQYFGCAVWDIWTAIKDLDPRHLGSYFDIAHATIEGGLDWPTHARLMEKYLMTVSVKDFVWEKAQNGAKTKWVPIGEGYVNKNFFSWLKATDFKGPISHHVEYDHGKGQEMIAKIQHDVKILKEWLA